MDFLTFEVHFPDGCVREFLLNSAAGRPSYKLLRMLIAEKAPENAAFKLAWRDSNSSFRPLRDGIDFKAAISDFESQNSKETADRSIVVNTELLTPAQCQKERGSDSGTESGSDRGLESESPPRRKSRVEEGVTISKKEKKRRQSTSNTAATEDLCTSRHSRKRETNQDDPISSNSLQKRRKPGGAKYYTCENCSTNFFSQSTLDKHTEMCDIPPVEENDAAEANSQCTQCGLDFPSDSLLLEHELSQHVVNQLICEYCGKGFDTQITLDYHMTSCRKSSIASIFCPQCRKSFLEEDSMREHFRTSHPGLKLVRFAPPTKSTAKSPSKERVTTGPGNVPSPKSTVKSPSKDTAAACAGNGDVEFLGISNSYPSGPLTCYVCGKAFPEKQQLGMHLMTHSIMHSPRDGSSLPVCFPTPSMLSPASAGFPSILNMPMNFQRIGPPFPVSAILSSKPAPPFAFFASVQGSFPCKVCGNVFQNNLELGRHLLDHIKTESIIKRKMNGCPPAVCAVCKKHCKDTADLHTHLSGHFREGMQSLGEFLSRPRPAPHKAAAPAEKVKCKRGRKEATVPEKPWQHTVKKDYHIPIFRKIRTKPDGRSSVAGLTNAPVNTGHCLSQRAASPDKKVSIQHSGTLKVPEETGQHNFCGGTTNTAAPDQVRVTPDITTSTDLKNPAPASPPPSSERCVVRIDLKQFSSVENVLNARKHRTETQQSAGPSKLDALLMEGPTSEDELETQEAELNDEMPPYSLDSAALVFLEAMGISLRESGILDS